MRALASDCVKATAEAPAESYMSDFAQTIPCMLANYPPQNGF